MKEWNNEHLCMLHCWLGGGGGWKLWTIDSGGGGRGLDLGVET